MGRYLLTEVVKRQQGNSTEALVVNLSEVIKEVGLYLEPMNPSSGTQLEIKAARTEYPIFFMHHRITAYRSFLPLVRTLSLGAYIQKHRIFTSSHVS